MITRENSAPISYYYSPHLEKCLEYIGKSRNSLLEAPAGYGKTTAVRHALESCGGRTYWFPSEPELSSEIYQHFMELLYLSDIKTIESFRMLGAPNNKNIDEFCGLLRTAKTQEDVYIVFYETYFQKAQFPNKVLEAVFSNKCEKIYRIYIAESYEAARICLDTGGNVCYIRRDDLALGADDIRVFYRKNGVSVSKKQANELFDMTGGWLLALSLNLDYIAVYGFSNKQFSVDELISRIFFEKLTKHQQEEGMLFGLFTEATEGQLCYLASLPEVTTEMRRILGKAPLVRYDPVQGMYSSHPVMNRFMRSRLENATRAVQKRVYIKAGDWYSLRGDRRNAISYYYMAGHYEGILSLDLTNLIRLKCNGKMFSDIAAEIAGAASPVMMKKYFLKMLHLDYIIFSSGKIESYEKLLTELYKYAEKSRDKRLLGEWELIAAYRKFPDLEAMKESFLRAEVLLKGNSRVLTAKEVCLFGCPSPWYLLYNAPGSAKALCGAASEVFAICMRIMGGRLSGAAELLEGEISCMQGDLHHAELSAYKAAYIAESAEQVTVSYGAALLLGRVEIARSDKLALESTLHNIESMPKRFPFIADTSINEYLYQSVRTMLYSMTVDSAQLPENRSMFYLPDDSGAFGTMMVSYVDVTNMISQKKYSQAIGYMEALERLDPRICTAAARHYIDIGLALCYQVTGEMEKAVECLERAIEVSAPDRIFTTFLRFREYLRPLFDLPEMQEKYADEIKEIFEIKTYYMQKEDPLFDTGVNPFVQESLTKRELEIARMAAQGMRNREIAETLSITERTVKAHMNVVFQKLGIDRRARLSEIIH